MAILLTYFVSANILGELVVDLTSIGNLDSNERVA